MELNNINSVSDLLAANQQQPEVTEHNDETLYELALEHLDATEATKLAIALVNQLAIYSLSPEHSHFGHSTTSSSLVSVSESFDYSINVGIKQRPDEAQLA